MNVDEIPIEIAFASETQQVILKMKVLRGKTLQEAIIASGILAIFPEINLQKMSVGVFGKIKNLTDFVHAGDRIEIYRPLKLDPKEARRQRAGR